MARMFLESGPRPVWSACTVAETAPQRVWPITTTSRVPNWAAANSMEPTTEGATTLPAMRTTNRSPKPSSKRISTGVRESEHPSTMANGRCAWLAWCSLHERARDSADASRKRRFPSTSRWSACCGESELGSQV